MRRKELEITDREEQRAILARARVCRVALCDGDRPYLVPLSFALDGDDLVFHSAREGRKLEILRRNPAVCFEVEEAVSLAHAPTACDFNWRFRTVIGQGDAVFVEDLAERTRLLGLFVPRFGAPPGPLPAHEVAQTCVFKVKVRELTGKRSSAG